MSDDKKKSEPKAPTSEMKTGPATGEPREGIELKLGESATLTSGSETPVMSDSDDLAAGVAGSSATSTPEVVRKPDRAPAQLSGKYTIKDGDTPFSVALEMYGQGSRGAELRRANKNVPWKTGAVISL